MYYAHEDREAREARALRSEPRALSSLRIFPFPISPFPRRQSFSSSNLSPLTIHNGSRH